MDANSAPLSEFDSEHEEEVVVELGEVSRETQGGPWGVILETGFTLWNG